MVSVKIDFGKKDFVWVGLVVVLLSVGFVVAYDWSVGSGSGLPSIQGHTANELEVNIPGQGTMTIQNAITNIQNDIDNLDGGIGGSVNSALGCIITDIAKGSNDVYGIIPLVLNGKNICEDDDGCTYMMMRVNPSDSQRPVYEIKKSNDQIIFQYASSGKWKDFGGDSQIGTNGDSTSKVFRGWGSNIDLMDDHTSGETSKDEWTLRVKKDYGGEVVRVVVCDFGI